MVSDLERARYEVESSKQLPELITPVSQHQMDRSIAHVTANYRPRIVNTIEGEG